MTAPYDLHTHRWAIGKPANIVALGLAQTLAVNAEMVHYLVRHLRRGQVDERLPARPSGKQWYKLYHYRRQVFLAAADAVPDVMGPGSEVNQCLNTTRMLSQYARTDPDGVKEVLACIEPQEWQQVIHDGQGLAHVAYQMHLEGLKRILNNEVPKETGDFDAELAASPTLYFYLRVTLPCIVVHRQFPAMLLQLVRRGKDSEKAKAVEKLVRVDDLAEHHPIVEAWVSRQPGPVRRQRKKFVRTWADQGLNHGQFTLKQVKLSMAGLISAIAETIGHRVDLKRGRLADGRLTAEHIRELFNAVAQDRAGRSMGVADKQLADMPIGSLRKALAGQKRLWKQVVVSTLPPVGGGQKSV